MGICRKSYRAIHIFTLCRHLSNQRADCNAGKKGKLGEAVERRQCNDRELRDVAVLFSPPAQQGCMTMRDRPLTTRTASVKERTDSILSHVFPWRMYNGAFLH